MKIGVLTLPLHINYGGILQAYALQDVLEGIGHEVLVIDTPQYVSVNFWKKVFPFLRRLALKMTGKSVCLDYVKEHNEKVRIERFYIQGFIEKYIHRLEIFSLTNIRDNQFDAIVVGSDQIWRASYLRKIWGVKDGFLGFAEDWNIMRISYAASFGVDVWEYNRRETRTCRRLIQKFKKVSVREASAKFLCSQYLGVLNVQHVLDPTMLLSKDEYIAKLFLENTCKNTKTLLVYILDMTEEKQRIIVYLSQKLNLIPYYVNEVAKDNQFKEGAIPPVERWLKGFITANYVFTDSFHACAFSINFNIPFLSYGNVMRGLDRFVSLLNTFGLEDRLITSFEAVESYYNRIIDWDKVNAVLDYKRKESVNFLRSI